MPKSAVFPFLVLCWTLFFGPAQAQSLLWNRPGLAIGAYHSNFFDGDRNTSQCYQHDTVVCGQVTHLFQAVAASSPGFYYGLRVEGGRVYGRPVTPFVAPCDTTFDRLWYDFDLQPGQHYIAPTNKVFTVLDTTPLTLLNGDVRRRRLLTDAAESDTLEWVEGLGDIRAGLFRDYYDFEGGDLFVCARDSAADLWLGSQPQACDSLLCRPPFPAFDAAVDGLTAHFDNQSHHAISYAWDFGDGTTSTEAEPEHTYTTPGCYEVRLTAWSHCLSTGQTLHRLVNVGLPAQWQQLSFPPMQSPNGLMDLSFPTPDTGWAVTSNMIWHTTDGGQTWTEQAYPAYPAPARRLLNSVHMLSTQVGIIGCGYYEFGVPGSELHSLLMTFDGGQTWENRSVGSANFVHDVLLTENGSGFAGASFGRLLRTTDGGATWSINNLSALYHFNRLFAPGADTLYALAYQWLDMLPVLGKSFDAGTSWTFVPLPNLGRDGAFLTPEKGWVANGPLHRTLDGGLTWEQQATNVQDVDFSDPQNGWAVGTFGHILRTTDGGASWVDEHCGLNEHFHTVEVAASDIAYAISTSSIWKYCPGGCLTTAAPAPDAARSDRLLLTPNPAASSVLITLPAAVAEPARVTVFDSFGRIVCQHVASGALTLNVSSWPAGVYIVCVQLADGRQRSARLVCLQRE